LPKPLARGIVFQKSAAPRPGLVIGAGHSGFGGVRNEMELKPLKTMNSANCRISRP
jgi:hypothetical protein